jgi:N-acetylgalactosamine-6-sulfatase
MTGGRRGYKASLLEGGIGVPFIARWPGIISSNKVDNVSLISAVDLLPTFCELAGVQLPSEYAPDGVSQVKTLLGEKYPRRTTPLFWKIGAKKDSPDHWVADALVHDKWKLACSDDLGRVELYDIASDPYEQKDLKGDNASVTADLLKRLAGWRATLPSKPMGSVFSAVRSK